ncbi:MAG: succinate dehydrogenase [Calditrichae bacterium]|nr:succinate dehydrogenase [Calditrichia bacterium]
MTSKLFFRSMNSTIGRKIVMSITGLFWVLFVIIHMLGNLSFLAGPDAFNSYSHKLISLGPILWALEALLVLTFLLHAYYAISVSLNNRQARPEKYHKLQSIGEPSRKTISSTSMIYTGIILLVFTIIHIKTFKYGPGIAEGYVTTINGETMRDLYSLVKETFNDPLYAFGYTIVMILLGYHLRHGFWSAFQSLGANHPRYSAGIYTVGVGLAIVLALGFVVLPILIYFIY